MPYDEKLAERVREHLSEHRKVEEKKMMGGLTFMVNSKMCVGILNDDLMVRIAPEEYERVIIAILEKGHTFSPTHLVNEIRSVFGFSRTGPILEETIKAVIYSLIRQGKLGEGSGGIGLRT